ncbi:hypothetical protein [Flavobacterium sp. 102]|uniref:hypothetical protein n=1 Tax=Flavobacterium sp. 102 TaxID=2135623 RepID=UPI000EB00203|nr:hypothetical protein [Flavobacterium sp. 102]
MSTDNFQNLFKPLTTSLKDAVSSCIAVHNVGMGIEEINNKERIRIEPLSYFYNPNVTIRLGQVQNVKRSEAVEHYFSSAEFGYQSGGD